MQTQTQHNAVTSIY